MSVRNCQTVALIVLVALLAMLSNGLGCYILYLHRGPLARVEPGRTPPARVEHDTVTQVTWRVWRDGKFAEFTVSGTNLLYGVGASELWLSDVQPLLRRMRESGTELPGYVSGRGVGGEVRR